MGAGIIPVLFYSIFDREHIVAGRVEGGSWIKVSKRSDIPW